MTDRIRHRGLAAAFTLTLLLALSLAFGVARSEAYVYWADSANDQISRAENDGTNVDPDFLWYTVSSPTDMAIDGTEIYWVNNSDNSVRRANIDGSGETLSAWIPSGVTSAWGVGIDSTYAYYTNIAGTSIGRKNRSTGTLDQTFITNTGAQPTSVAVSGSYVYWTHSDNAIGRANIDGTGVNANFITGLSGARGIAVNGSYIYWAGYSTAGIGRANLDGSGVNQSFISSARPTSGVAVDANHIYWTFPTQGRIGRANLDGSGVNVSFIQNAGSPDAVAVDGKASPPTLTIDSGPSGPSNDSTPTFGFTSSGTTITCSIDQGPPSWVPCSSPFTAPGSLADGDWTFRVHAVTALGGQADQSRSFTVDTNPPQTTILDSDIQAGNGYALFYFSSPDLGASFACQLDSDGWQSCNSPWDYSDLADGEHTFRVQAEDTAGNVDPTPSEEVFTVDKTLPETTITSGPSGTIASGEATFEFSSSENDSAFSCKLDDGDWLACVSPLNLTDLANGPHTFDVAAADEYGNLDSSPATRSFTVDVGPTGPTGPTEPTGPTGPVTPSNAFTFGKLKLNKKKGTALLQVKVPGAGKLRLIGSKTVKPAAKTAKAKSTFALKVRAKGKAAKQLKKKGKVKLTVRVRFTPTGGKPKTKTKSVKLLKR